VTAPRKRVRRFLSGREGDRPPFVAFATELAARLEQVDPERLIEEPNALTRALLGLQELFRLEAIVLEVPADTLPRAGGAVAEGLKRLRALLGERAAVVLALPGPRTIAAVADEPPTAEALDRFGSELLAAAASLEPQHADCLAVLERVEVRDEEIAALDEALTPLWNAARYYSLPSLLVLARAGRAAAGSGANAVAVWEGATGAELVQAGARRVGIPVTVGAASPPPLPPGGFWTTAGELPAQTEVEWLHELVSAVQAPE
jgi:hypothetical protein